MVKLTLGVVCIILGIEYAWVVHAYRGASYEILYVADTFTWLFAGLILFTEGLFSYLSVLKGLEISLRVEKTAKTSRD